MTRESIFISHATPEDNAFTRWLGSKLELAGYKVWFDLDRLKGGDLFWDKIEAAIRNESIKFLAVVSTVSVDKSGVKDEWAVAATVEKSLPGFVIPIRIDNYDFSQLPIAIHRKNVIDFARGWHLGFASLLDTLADSKTPKVSIPDPSIARHWLPEMKEGAILRKASKESLDSSWLRIISLPPAIETARILGTDRKIPVTKENSALPWFEFEDRIVGFAKAADLVALMSKTVKLKAGGGVDAKAFVEEGSSWGENPVSPFEARRRVVNLIRQAWELAMEARGFGVHYLSRGRKIFYVTPKLTGGNGKFVNFVDEEGRKRRKTLNGHSEVKRANWSYAVGMVPSLDDPWRIELRATIVFTDEEGLPIEAPLRAHQLRRSFCKNWWNEQWRMLMRAFLWVASEGKPEIELPVGSGRSIVVSASPIVFESPIGLTDTAPAEDVEPVEELDIEDDEIDDVEEPVA
jgi:hypothetical protein